MINKILSYFSGRHYKQFVRDYLETLSWNKQPPGPELPPDVVAGTRARYVEAYERIVGEPFAS